MFRFIPAALAVLALSAPAVAEIYQYKDADGKVHFTDKPPANQKTDTVNIHMAPTPAAAASSSAAPAESPLERQKKILKVMDEERAAKNEAAQKANDERQKRQMECARLKDQQRQFAQGGRFYTVDAKGERVYKNDEEIGRQREQVNNALRSCR